MVAEAPIFDNAMVSVSIAPEPAYIPPVESTDFETSTTGSSSTSSNTPDCCPAPGSRPCCSTRPEDISPIATEFGESFGVGVDEKNSQAFISAHDAFVDLGPGFHFDVDVGTGKFSGRIDSDGTIKGGFVSHELIQQAEKRPILTPRERIMDELRRRQEGVRSDSGSQVESDDAGVQHGQEVATNNNSAEPPRPPTPYIPIIKSSTPIVTDSISPEETVDSVPRSPVVPNVLPEYQTIVSSVNYSVKQEGVPVQSDGNQTVAENMIDSNEVSTPEIDKNTVSLPVEIPVFENKKVDVQNDLFEKEVAQSGSNPVSGPTAEYVESAVVSPVPHSGLAPGSDLPKSDQPSAVDLTESTANAATTPMYEPDVRIFGEMDYTLRGELPPKIETTVDQSHGEIGDKNFGEEKVIHDFQSSSVDVLTNSIELNNEPICESIDPTVLFERREFVQLEGALATVVLKLNRLVETDPIVHEIWKDISGDSPFLTMVNLDPEFRNRYFTPNKYPVDMELGWGTNHFKLDTDEWILKNRRPGHFVVIGDLLVEHPFYSNVSLLKECFGGISTENLDCLYIVQGEKIDPDNPSEVIPVGGMVSMPNAVLRGNIRIVSAYDGIVDLNSSEARELLDQKESGRLVLSNVDIRINSKGTITDVSTFM